MSAGKAIRALLRRPLLRVRGELSQDVLRKRGLRLGSNVYIGQGTRLDTGFLWLISIADDVTISANVTILAHDAAMKRATGYSQIAPVTIGRGAYIGAGAIVLPGATIGEGAIVGAGSVVRRSIPDGMVAVGSPARVIGTAEDLAERHRRLMATRPRYAADGWTYAGGITPERRDRMSAELADGPGYVE